MNKMKESGMAWIGLIPEEWDVLKLKEICKGFSNGTSAEQLVYEDSDYPVTRIETISLGRINYEKVGYIEKNLSSYKLNINDILVSNINSIQYLGNCAMYEGEQTLYHGMNLLRVIPEKINPQYLLHYFKSICFKINMQIMCKPAINQASVSALNIKNMKMPFPSLEEQQRIADFLDDKVGKVDEILTDLNNQVEILQKYKKSVITQAVTKGLNPDVAMKDSGIDWIGEIPEHWNCKKLKYILNNPLMYGANESGEDFDENYPRYIRITDIDEDNNLKEDGKLSLLPEVAKSYILKDGDILFARSGATVGKTYLYKKEDGVAAFAGYLIKADINNDLSLPEYVYYSTLGVGYDNWKNSVFTQATIQNIGADKYSTYVIPLPTIEEQGQIVDYLKKKCAKIDELIKDKQAQIEKMEKYKKSLIYEYVTGKKRVKGV